MVTITRSAAGASLAIRILLEDAVHEALADADEPLEVQFNTWVADDGHVQFVCRVETPPADPFGPAVQWRWWSPLVEGADDLRVFLRSALEARRRRSTGDGPAAAEGAELNAQ
jgi:hypothetical protein